MAFRSEEWFLGNAVCVRRLDAFSVPSDEWRAFQRWLMDNIRDGGFRLRPFYSDYEAWCLGRPYERLPDNEKLELNRCDV